MSRSGYTDDIEDTWRHICWRGAVAASIRGARGQAFLRELADALDAMPEKRLVADSLATADGEFCALGAVGAARGMDMSTIDPEDYRAVAEKFGLARAMAQEIMYLNDEWISVEYKWVRVEICGPMRPHHPDHGEHIRERSLPNPNAGVDRWRAMREWVRKNTAAKAAATEK